MIVRSLADNICAPESQALGCACEHGLSLYIELDCGAKILFDTGQSDLFARNAERMGIDLGAVDLAVISHGHYDHGGGLEEFMRINSKAPIYIRETAFEPHYSIKPEGPKFIGLNSAVSSRFCLNAENLPYGITLFSNPPHVFPEPPGNRLLLTNDRPDDFSHEQSMIIREGSNAVLFGGCAHRGVVNILRRARSLAPVTHVLSGMHLAHIDPSNPYVAALAEELMSFSDIDYYTMHCTGMSGYNALKDIMGPRISYLAAGSSIVIAVDKL